MTVTVRFDRPPPTVFAYLADPRHRPAWQPSLRAVRLLDDGEPRVGMRWLDVTWAGVRPALEITTFEPDRRWSERGRWRGITAELTLRFAAEGAGTAVTAELAVAGTGGWRPVALALDLLAPRAVRHDLRRAARILGAGARG